MGRQYFLRVSPQRGETRKSLRNGYCGTVCRLSLSYKFAGIKRKNAVCLDVRPARRPPLTVHPLLYLSFAGRQSALSLSLGIRYRGAHFWGFVGFLIKGAAVTPMARMRGIARGISSKNHPPHPSEISGSPRFS